VRVFYVIYVSDERLRSALDTIRLLVWPAVSHPAHITVRGPYTQRRNVAALSSSIEGEPVTLQNVGYFFEKGQHTVYFEAAATLLPTVWHKESFGFNPHLTLYDGPSRPRAIGLYQLLTRFPIVLSFVAQGLEPLISNGGQGNLSVVNGIDFDFISNIAHMRLDPSTLFALPDRHKDAVIERLCRHLCDQSVGKPVPGTGSRIGLTTGWSQMKHLPGRAATGKPWPTQERGAVDPVGEAWNAWRFLRKRDPFVSTAAAHRGPPYRY
jgi:hypothetical protein